MVAMAKRSGERGSPCGMPFSMEKVGEERDPISTVVIEGARMASRWWR